MFTPFNLKLTGGGGGGGGAAGAPRPPPPRRPPPPSAGAAPAAAPPPAPPRAAPPAGGAASPPRPPPRAPPPRPPRPPPAGAAGGGGGITTPISIHGLASVPSPLTHPMIVCSVPCAARPITATPAKTNVPKTLNFIDSSPMPRATRWQSNSAGEATTLYARRSIVRMRCEGPGRSNTPRGRGRHLNARYEKMRGPPFRALNCGCDDTCSSRRTIRISALFRGRSRAGRESAHVSLKESR
jgi:hypothetical protein